MIRLRAPWIAAAAAVLAVGLAVVEPAAAARGWLIGFLACATPVIGAVALTLVARLTGAGWGVQTCIVAAAAPPLLILWLPLAFGAVRIYPWAQGVAGPGHASQYLGIGPFVLRSLVALAVWAFVAWRLVTSRPGRPALGLALVAHAVLVIVVGVDWVLSLHPGWMSSDFGMNLAAQQIAAGAAIAILAAGPGGEDAALRDLTTLVLAGSLGVAYLGFMDYLVVWYGALPDRVSWYLARDSWAAHGLVVAALAIGAAGPALIAAAPWPAPRLKARAAAVCALIGLALYQLYLVLPIVGGWSLVAAALAATAQAAGLVWFARRSGSSANVRELAHG